MSRILTLLCGGCDSDTPVTSPFRMCNPCAQVCEDPGQSFGGDKLQQRYDDAQLMVFFAIFENCGTCCHRSPM